MCRLWNCNNDDCHYCLRKAEREKPKPLKRTALKSNSCKNCTSSKRKPIKPRSTKRAKQEREYRNKTRPEKLKQDPNCEAKLSGCTVVATELHHMRGRIGDLLNDMDNLLSVCRNCHRRIELQPEMAKELNLSVKRIT